jgi:SAM-dependent methyltransferase
VLSSPATVATLLALLWCPDDHGDLTLAGGAAACTSCGRRYPFTDGVLSFLDTGAMSEIDRRELASRDAEATWYDTIFGDYTNAVEVPTTVARIGVPAGPVLDFGAGTGRVTTHLAKTFDQPVIAVDYSSEQLRRLVPRCAGYAVLPVHADGRRLPIRDGVIAAATSAEVYEHFRPDDRRLALDELARVMRSGAPLSISTLSYNALYRLWRLRGNRGAKEGDHLLGGDFYYVRQTAREFRRELRQVFTVEQVVGIRNIPVRSITSALRKVAGEGRGDRFEAWMTRRGHRLDRAWERVPLSPLTGFFLLARCRKP